MAAFVFQLLGHRHSPWLDDTGAAKIRIVAPPVQLRQGRRLGDAVDVVQATAAVGSIVHRGRDAIGDAGAENVKPQRIQHVALKQRPNGILRCDVGVSFAAGRPLDGRVSDGGQDGVEDLGAAADQTEVVRNNGRVRPGKGSHAVHELADRLIVFSGGRHAQDAHKLAAQSLSFQIERETGVVLPRHAGGGLQDIMADDLGHAPTAHDLC
ncbi:hypothetical protein VTN96DRAFT_6696 [Rasamsonia emersonii]